MAPEDGSEPRDEPPEYGHEEPSAAVQPKPDEDLLAEPEELPPSLVDGAEHSVDSAAISLHRLLGGLWVGGIGGSVFLILLLVGVLVGSSPSQKAALPVVWGILALAGALIAWRWPVLHHRCLRYRVDQKGVQIRRGVLWRKVISIPTSRVQHTDLTQGPAQRKFGLAKLTVHTAGTQNASIPLSGLRHEVALRLRDHLLPKDAPSSDQIASS